MQSMFRSGSRAARVLSALLTLAMVLQLASPATYALAEEAVPSEEAYEAPVVADESGESVTEPEEPASPAASDDAETEPVALGTAEAMDGPEVTPESDAPADQDEQADVFVAEGPTEEATYDDVPTGEDLLAGYIEQQFSQELPNAAGEPQRLGNAGKYLTGNDAVMYDLLKDMIAEVAAGTRTSTTFTIPLTTLTGGKTSWTAADLGVSAITSGGPLTSEARAAYASLTSFNQSIVLDSLLVDCPYDLYWFDKTLGTSWRGSSFYYNSNRIYVTEDATLTFYMYVSSDYASDTFSVDPSYGTRVRTAVAKAKGIVSGNAGKSVYDRLVAYRDAICELVSYNNDAANGGASYGDPWQLVNVFDGNTSTKVVCEGYSKAFKYLCDLSNFANVDCRLVSGQMAGGTGAGAHMWNVVTMPDGKNYMVDVTNSDSGTIGQRGELFIVPCASGSVSSQYNFYNENGTGISYAYDSDTRSVWSTADLTLSSAPYDPANDIQQISIADATVTVSDQTYTGSALTPAVTVRLNGTTLTKNVDYSVAYSNNTNAGTATVTITGLGNYTDSTTASFTINKATVNVPSATTGLTYTGYSQRGVETGTGYSLSGTTSATNAGTYSATATLSDTANYTWSDGTSGAKSISWTIAKAKVTPPTARTGLVYSGLSQTAVALGSGFSLSGTLSAVDAGTYTVTARLSDTTNYSWTDGTTASKTINWSIAAASLSSASVSAIPAQTYTGSALKPEPTLTWNGTTLVEGTDYTLSYRNNTAVGTATVTITGTGNFAGTRTTSFSITAAPKVSISSASVSSIGPRTYDGSAQTPEPTVTYGGKTLAKGTDYTLSYRNNTNAGTATVTITGIGDYTGTRTASFTINRRTIAIPTPKELTYTGRIQSALSATDDYDIAGTSGATHSGTYSTTLVLTDKGNTSWPDGTTADKVISWTIAKAKMGDATIAAIPPQTYNGSEQKPTVTVRYNGTAISTGAGYTVTYSNNTNAGTATVTITGTNDFTGTKTATFAINKLSVAIPTARTGLVYTGSSQSGVDAGEGYALSGTVGATVVGTYTTRASLSDTANLVWSDGTSTTKSISWNIGKASISSVSVSTIPTQSYTGSALRPEPTLTWNGRTLTRGTDYTLSYKDNTAVGTATVTISGTGNFTGTTTADFQIVRTAPDKVDISSATVSKIADLTYNGSAHTPAPTVTLGGKTLVRGIDYTLSYSDNTNAGTATVTITGKGGYTGTKSVTFTIARRTIAIPTPRDITYTGEMQDGSIQENDDFSVCGITGATYAGPYDITVSLRDERNTMWSDGTTAAKDIVWCIVPKRVAVPKAETGLTYDGSSQRGVPAGADYGLYGEEVAISAGTHTATAYLIDEQNTMWSDDTLAEKDIDWSIAQADISGATVAGIADQAHTGSAVKPEPEVTWNGKTLKKGTDYTLSYRNNTNVGTATVTISGRGNFTGTTTASFAISKTDPDKIDIAESGVAIVSGSYDGTPQTPPVTVTKAGKTLRQGTDYTLTYTNNTNAGTGTVTITGIGSYTGSMTATFIINKADVAPPTATTGLIYNGSSQRGVPTGANYTLSGTATATDAGTYTATARLTDKNNYCWYDGSTTDRTVSWSIAKANISGATVAKIADQTHTGSAIKPEPKVTWNGRTLEKGADYTVTYKDNISVGTATVTFTGRGNFTGTRNATFSIVADEAPETARVAVYRLYNKKTSEHLWTTSPSEYEQLPVITKGDWRQEGVAWMAPDGVGTPVYRLYNRKMGDHYYSMSQGEINALTTKHGWSLDNNGRPAFWSAARADEGVSPLFCVYNSRLKKGQHHFTASVAERDFLVANAGWRYEKEAFYGYLPQ